MENLYVAFTDVSQATIAMYFAGPQSTTTFPYQGTVLASDPRWAAFYNSMPVMAQAYLPAPA